MRAAHLMLATVSLVSCLFSCVAIVEGLEANEEDLTSVQVCASDYRPL